MQSGLTSHNLVEVEGNDEKDECIRPSYRTAGTDQREAILPVLALALLASPLLTFGSSMQDSSQRRHDGNNQRELEGLMKATMRALASAMCFP